MNNVPTSLYAVELERACLGGLIKNPKILVDLSGFLNNSDFFYREHNIIFSILKSLVLSGQNVDKVILAQKVRELGISHFNEIDIFTYCDDISFSQINAAGIQNTAKELIKLRVKRDLWESANQVQQYIKESKDDSVNQLISNVDKINSSKIELYNEQDRPLDLYDGIEDFINERVGKSEESYGLITPFKRFNDIYGACAFGASVFSIVARPKNHKSTFLQNMAEGMVRLNPDTKALIIDTEMSSEIMRLRGTSAITQVPYYYMNTGKWAQNKELVEKVKNNINRLKELKGKIFHISAPDKSIEDICGIIKRWFYQFCGRNGKAVVILDYIKVSGEAVNGNNTEYMIVGNKVNALNKIAKELGLVVWTACQMNRKGEGAEAADDGSAIALSDRLAWYASFVGIFRKKRIEEMTSDGLAFGSHKMIPLYTRFGGRDFNKSTDLVKVLNDRGKYENKYNFLSYNISEFQVEEKGDLNDIVKHNSLHKPLQKDIETKTEVTI